MDTMYSTFIFCCIVIKLVGNQHNHKISDKFQILATSVH